MTNRIAVGLVLVIAALIGINFALGLEAHVFLARRFVELVDWAAFWR
ncbi:MAG: hypothetical protein AAFR35_10175 [Pseudomonadota bacterium]